MSDETAFVIHRVQIVRSILLRVADGLEFSGDVFGEFLGDDRRHLSRPSLHKAAKDRQLPNQRRAKPSLFFLQFIEDVREKQPEIGHRFLPRVARHADIGIEEGSQEPVIGRLDDDGNISNKLEWIGIERGYGNNQGQGFRLYDNLDLLVLSQLQPFQRLQHPVLVDRLNYVAHKRTPPFSSIMMIAGAFSESKTRPLHRRSRRGRRG